MRAILLYAFLLFAMGSASAMYLQIVGPVSGTVYNNGSIYLGKVGPGESFYVLASAETTNASGKLINIGWDTLEGVALPNGWYAQASPLYENPMKVKITTSNDTQQGTYHMILRAVNVENYSRLGNLTINAFVNVTPDVLNVSVTPEVVEVGVGQPGNLYITINNTGISDDPFIINAYNLPAWNLPEEVIALHGRSTTFVYPTYIDEPGVYPFSLTVYAATSPFLIRSTYNISLIAKASLLNDFGAVGEGTVLSPIIYEPAYAIMLFIQKIIEAVAK